MNKTAKDLMHNITVVPADTTVQEAAELMAKKNIGSVIVEVDGKLEGILTERDILKKVTAKALDPKKIGVTDLMSSPLKTINADADIYEIAQFFRESNIRRLPVKEKGKILGVLTTRDVTRALIPNFYRDNPLFKEIKDYRKEG